MTSDTLVSHQLNASPFGFSAVGIEDLGATEYTLVTLAVDVSSSVAHFEREMLDCLKEIIDACRKSPRADNLLIRLVQFASGLDEIHGFKPLEQCHPSSYDSCLNVGGMTALADGTVNALEAMGKYGKDLVENDFDVNGILIVITDGMDNHSTNTPQQAEDLLKAIARDEVLESTVSILVGVNVQEADIQRYLTAYETTVGFNKYVELDNAKASTLAKLAEFVSKSISAQSQALGTGGPSQVLSF